MFQHIVEFQEKEYRLHLAEEEKQYRGKKPKVLVVNWDRLEEEGLWSNSNS